MNHTATSKDELIKAAKEIITAQGAEQLNIRLLAKNCGVAVGSVYNYFPTKAALSIAVVGDFWAAAFHGNTCMTDADGSFPRLVERIYHTADSRLGDNRSFFTVHPAIIGDKDRASGKAAMEACFVHIKQALLYTLRADKRVKQGLWTAEFTEEAFVGFIFSNILALLSSSADDCACLVQVIERVLYEA